MGNLVLRFAGRSATRPSGQDHTPGPSETARRFQDDAGAGDKRGRRKQIIRMIIRTTDKERARQMSSPRCPVDSLAPSANYSDHRRVGLRRGSRLSAIQRV